MKQYRISVYGKVQGVFFRANTLRVASGLGLNGWVRNQEDGTVLIEAEGNTEKLEELLHWCKSGPEYASVEKVEYHEIAVSSMNEFRILR